MRCYSQYTLHPKEDRTCFICGAKRKCYGYIPARTVDADGPYYMISLCMVHATAVNTAKNALRDIDTLIRRFGSAVKLSNRIPGHEINEFCRLTTTDVAQGYTVHSLVVSSNCFYCNKPSNNRRDRSPTSGQLLKGTNSELPRYVVPCCKPCYEVLSYYGTSEVSLEARATLLAKHAKAREEGHKVNYYSKKETKQEESPCIGDSIWD